jgi:hypothetical protein
MRLLAVLSCIVSALSFGTVGPAIAAQAERWGKVRAVVLRDSLEADSSLQKVFAAVQQAMVTGEWTSLQDLFAEHVSMHVDRPDAGYVSPLQAVSILSAFHAARKPAGFAFSRIATDSPNPFATGRLYYVHRGTKKSAQVYVALSLAPAGWRISQISIFQ